MTRYGFLTVIVLAWLGCSGDSTADDLGVVCSAFQALQAEGGLDGMSASARLRYVEDKVEGELSAGGNVQEVWGSFPNFSSDSKYSLFKSTAESLLEKPWECAAMQQLAPTMGP